MNKINPSDSLNSSISLLEQKRAADFIPLKQQLRETGESLKPGNIIKSAVRDISGSSHFKSVLIKAAIGLAIGFVAKKVVTSQKHDKKTRLMGNALQYGLSFLAANRNNFIQSAGSYAVRQLVGAYKKRRMRRHLSNGVPHEN